MIKPILSNSIGKTFVATAMLATAVIGTNAETIKNKQQNNAEQTELVSKETAQALKSNAIALNNKSIEHNKKIDKVYIKNCEPEKSVKNKKSSLDAMYNVYGSYGANIQIQTAIDTHFIKGTINSYLEHLSFLNENRAKAQSIFSEFYEWQNNEFYSDLYQEELKMYEKEEYPSVETAINFVDKQILNPKYFEKGDIKIYEKGCDIFKSEQKDGNSPQGKSDLLAYKVHLMNSLAFFNQLTKKHELPDEYIFTYYFNYEFLNGEASIKP